MKSTLLSDDVPGQRADHATLPACSDTPCDKETCSQRRPCHREYYCLQKFGFPALLAISLQEEIGQSYFKSISNQNTSQIVFCLSIAEHNVRLNNIFSADTPQR